MRNSIRNYFFEEQRHQILSEARCEINMQEFKTESADIALRDLNTQIHSHRMEPYLTNQVHDNSRWQEALAPSRTGKPIKSSSRNSYQNSSRSGRIERDLLFRLHFHPFSSFLLFSSVLFSSFLFSFSCSSLFFTLSLSFSLSLCRENLC